MKSAAISIVVLMALAGCRGAATMDAETVGVEFHSDPSGADVLVDGILAGHTPLSASFDWPPSNDERKVEFRLTGYLPEVRPLKPTTAVIAVRLQEAVGMYAVRIETDPPGATIELDDKPAGVTPAQVRINTSTVTTRRPVLRVILPGYRTEEIPVDGLRRDETIRLQLKPLLPRLP
jgi:hypothetical protein